MGFGRGGLDAYLMRGAIQSRGVDLEPRPTVAILVAHFPCQAVVDEDSKPYSDVSGGAFVVVVEAPVRDELVPKRNVPKCGSHRLTSRWVLPHAAAGLEIEIGHHGGADPKPRPGRVADEALGRR